LIVHGGVSWRPALIGRLAAKGTKSTCIRQLQNDLRKDGQDGWASPNHVKYHVC
jgi:hypothetical protein